MKYFKDLENTVWALELDGSQDYLIDERSLIEISEDEMKILIDHQDTWDEDRKILNYRQNMPTLKPIDFDIKLNDEGLYDAVQELIKDNFDLRIAYNRATYFSRTDPFVDQARIALGLTNEQVDVIWTQP